MNDYNLKMGIIEELTNICKIVHQKNKLNSTDIHRLCENMFCNIFNILFEWELMVLNTPSNPRNIAVDLGDRKRHIYIQVTATNKKEKIEETLRKFAKNYAKKDILKIFIVGEKPVYKKIDTAGIKFNVNKDIWDINTIIEKIDNTISKNIAIRKELNKFKDSGIMDTVSIEEKTKNLTAKKTIIEYNIASVSKYVYGKGDVFLEAFLPLNYQAQLSGLLLFRKKEIEDVWITFNQSKAMNSLFKNNYHKNLKDRNFFLFEDNNKVWLKIFDMRFSVEKMTAEHLCILLDNLEEEFDKLTKKINTLLGTENFEKTEDGKYVLAQMPKYVWNSMFRFAQERDYGASKDNWNMFYTSFLDDRIKIYKNMYSTEKGDVLAQLFCKEKDRNNVYILWEPGFTENDDPQAEFDNKIKWKADYTCNWLINELIPRALFEQEGKWHQKYNKYRDCYDPDKRNIISMENNCKKRADYD